jgi:hypothetical protein
MDEKNVNLASFFVPLPTSSFSVFFYFLFFMIVFKKRRRKITERMHPREAERSEKLRAREDCHQ